MTKIEGAERDALILKILNRIDDDKQIVGAPERTAVWENGWAEALHKFHQKPVVESLVPAYIHHDQPVRWHGDFYHQDEKLNELQFVRTMQAKVGDYMEDCKHVCEFGCGTGLNLVALAQRFPDKTFAGYDFSASAVRLVREVWNSLNLDIAAQQFDMWKDECKIKRGSGVFTFGAIEQLAGAFRVFLENLIACKPKIVVHVEPTIELYDPDSLFDALAIRFHRKRGYTEGLLPWLQNDPRVEVIEAKRSHCGSLMMEGYTLTAWRLK